MQPTALAGSKQPSAPAVGTLGTSCLALWWMYEGKHRCRQQVLAFLPYLIVLVQIFSSSFLFITHTFHSHGHTCLPKCMYSHCTAVSSRPMGARGVGVR